MTITDWMRDNFDVLAGERVQDAMRCAKEDGLRVKSEAAMFAAFTREHERRATLRRRLKARAA